MLAEKQKKINDEMRAEADLARMLESSKGEQLRSKLADLANTKRIDAYSHRVADGATLLQMRLEKQGEESVTHMVKSMKTSAWFPGGNVKRREK